MVGPGVDAAIYNAAGRDWLLKEREEIGEIPVGEVALKLNIDETSDFLLHAGYAISPYSKIDLVFEYYIRSGKYDVYEISFALEDLGIEGGLWPELEK